MDSNKFGYFWTVWTVVKSGRSEQSYGLVRKNLLWCIKRFLDGLREFTLISITADYGVVFVGDWQVGGGGGRIALKAWGAEKGARPIIITCFVVVNLKKNLVWWIWRNSFEVCVSPWSNVVVFMPHHIWWCAYKALFAKKNFLLENYSSYDFSLIFSRIFQNFIILRISFHENIFTFFLYLLSYLICLFLL